VYRICTIVLETIRAGSIPARPTMKTREEMIDEIIQTAVDHEGNTDLYDEIRMDLVSATDEEIKTLFDFWGLNNEPVGRN
jgi:hypothetical protein